MWENSLNANKRVAKQKVVLFCETIFRFKLNDEKNGFNLVINI